MKVKTLIENLQCMPQEAEVKLHHFTGEEVLFALKIKGDDKIVWLETESDNDMKEEIGARFAYAEENQLDELDFYTNLLEIGINVEMVRKYIGNETADHMKQFCEEHGLM